MRKNTIYTVLEIENGLPNNIQSFSTKLKTFNLFKNLAKQLNNNLSSNQIHTAFKNHDIIFDNNNSSIQLIQHSVI